MVYINISYYTCTASRASLPTKDTAAIFFSCICRSEITKHFLVAGRTCSYCIVYVDQKAWNTSNRNEPEAASAANKGHGKERQFGRPPPYVCRGHHPWLLPETDTNFPQPPSWGPAHYFTLSIYFYGGFHQLPWKFPWK